MKDQEIQNSNEQQRSFAPLVRVLIVFPIIVIAGSYVGRLIVDTYELPSPGSFLGFVGLATVLGWFYVGYEYKRARKKLSLDKKSKQ
jgi:hypothetical protein